MGQTTVVTPRDRAAFYKAAFPKWPTPFSDDRSLSGIWVIGNSYKGSGYYGSYPGNYLKRVNAMFPDAKRVLHLFSGSLPRSEDYTRFDRIETADVVGDAEHLDEYFAPGAFDLVIADPPYTDEDAKRYGCERNVNRRAVFAGCHYLLEPGGNLVWLDLIHPMWSKASWQCWGLVGMVGSTNHRVRLVSMFQRLAGPAQPLENK